MLFGARIEEAGNCNGSYRLVVKRQRRQWGTLAWAVITAMLQDRELELFNFRMRAVSGCVEFRTRACQFLGASWKRWYPDGELKMPDMVIGDRELLFWILGAWGYGKPVRLDLMGGHAAVKTPWPVKKTVGGYEIRDVPEVQRWLELVVPRKVLM